MNYTSIEQSKKLLELGLSPESADMAYIENPIGEFKPVAYTPKETIVARDARGNDAIIYPCWSVGALWKLMPNIRTEYGIIRPKSVKESSKHYPFRYYYETLHYTDICSTPIEAAFNMIVWLIENNYIKKEE